MSAFGPALFVTRTDGKPLDDSEQATILDRIRALSPRARVYDYDDYEPLALGVLLHSSYGYQHLPDEVREDQDTAWAEEALRIAAAVDSQTPGRYAYQTYPVED